MTVNYTTLLGLAQPVSGTESGTWGDTVNNNLTAYLDDAIAGAQIISGTLTAVTLSKTTGASLSQAGTGATGSSQYQIIRCTGAPASLLTITVPAANKTYVVINATSTSQSVKIVGAGPTAGVTITSGKTSIVSWNGSDFVEITPPDPTGITTAVALGSIASGDVVYYNTDGTISTASSASFTAAVTPTSTAATSLSSAFDTVNGVAVVCYSTSTSNNGYAAVCNGNSGSTPSYGTPVLFSGATAVADTKIVYDTASAKMLIMYKDTSNNWYGIVGTVSGTTISFGTAVSFTAATKLDIAYGSSSSSSTIAYINSSTNTPYFATATVSGTSVSFGASTVINASVTTASEIQISRGSGSQWVVIYGYPSFYAVSMSYDGITISNTFTFPTLPTIFKPAICNYDQVRFVIAYANTQNTISVRTLIATSGTSSYSLIGAETIVLQPASINLNLYKDVLSSNILLTSRNVAANANVAIMSVGPEVVDTNSPGTLVINNSNAFWNINAGNGVSGSGTYSMVYDTVSQRTIFSYIGGLVRIYTKNIKLPSFNYRNVLGIANGAYTTGATATVITSGKIAANQTGLSVGRNYYINELTGVKQTTQTVIYLGKSVSTTSILVKG
jgi:hypothetical protein